MIARHVHQAIAQVRELKNQVIDRQRFTGYSGRSRMVCGVAALSAAIILSSPRFPAADGARLLGWGGLFLFALLANYGALLYWFLYDPQVRRDWRKLRPTVDVFPPLVVGGVLSGALIAAGQFSLLFGTWMCCFGLSNLASRHVLPRSISLVGLFYLTCGAVCLLWPGLTFTNPWPMGLTFFCGELLAGCILHFDARRQIA